MDKLPLKNRKRLAEKDVATPKIAKKRKTKNQPAITSEPRVDDTIFPFLKLPGELRNMIYRYALIDPDYSIRFEATVSKRDGRCILVRLFRARPGPPDRDDLPGQTRGSITKPSHSYKPIDTFRRPQASFGVTFLQTCRAINAEAASYFYAGNMFTFEAVPHVYAFLVHFHARLALVRNIGFSSVCIRHATYQGPEYLVRMPLATIFPLLMGATGLESLYLSVSVLQSLGGRSHVAARVLFHMAFAWMHSLGGQKALDVIKLPVVVGGVGSRWATCSLLQAEFQKEIKGALAMGQI